MNSKKIIELEKRYLVPTYARPPFLLTHGEGVYVFDSDGRKYLDGAAGIAVNALGYGNSTIISAIRDAASGLIHISNLFYTAPQVELAKVLCEKSFAERVFFANSGTEAMEAAMKFARNFARKQDGANRAGFVVFRGSFHGRTMGSLAVTDSEAYQAPFRPLMPGVTFADFNSLDSAHKAVTDETAAVIVEPVQGEGGVYPATEEFLRGLRELCNTRSALLIFDEIQCGLGRTGKLWAHEYSRVKPDMMVLAKPLAGGLPIGATLVTEKIGTAMHVGGHGSTFGGGPLITSVALKVFGRISDPGFLASVQEKGAYLMDRLRRIASPHIREVRGRGLMIGVELDIPAQKVLEKGYEHGLLLIKARDSVVRFLPPLIIEKTHIDELLDKFERILKEV